jgi:hypothetical protein
VCSVVSGVNSCSRSFESSLPDAAVLLSVVYLADRSSTVVSFTSGALAGAAATVASYPFDLLRTTLAAQGEPKVCFLLAYTAQRKKPQNYLSEWQTCCCGWEQWEHQGCTASA